MHGGRRLPCLHCAAARLEFRCIYVYLVRRGEVEVGARYSWVGFYPDYIGRVRSFLWQAGQELGDKGSEG